MKASILERKLFRRLCGLIVGMMFACGAAFILSSALGLRVERPYIFLTCLITLGILSACFYNKITTLVTLLAVGGYAAWFFVWGGGVAWITEGDGRALIDSLLSLVRTGVGDDASRHLAARLIAYAACLVSFCTACRLAGAVTLGVGSLALFIAVWIYGYHEIFGCFALCASATAAVSAAGYGRRMARLAARAEDSEEQGDRTDAVHAGSPAGIALFAIPLVVVIAIVCTFFRPLTLAPAFRVKFIEQALDDAADIIASHYSDFSRRTSVFSLNAVGYGSAADLGGPVKLSDDLTLVVGAQAGKVSLLRGSVRANYTGRGWEEGALSGSYRFTSSLWKDERVDAFDLERSVSLANSRFVSAFEYTTVRVQHFAHYTSMFSVERPDSVLCRAETPYFNMQGELFPKAALGEGGSYTVTGWAFKGMTKSVRRSLSKLVENAEHEERDEFIDKLYADYLPGGEVDIDAFVGNKFGVSRGVEFSASSDTTDATDTWVKVSLVGIEWDDGSTSRLSLYDSGLVPYRVNENQSLMINPSDMQTLDLAKYNQTPTSYALFYGYTKEQLDEKNLLDARRERGFEIGDREYPEPTGFYLSDARLASYGLDIEGLKSLMASTFYRLSYEDIIWNAESRETVRSCAVEPGNEPSVSTSLARFDGRTYPPSSTYASAFVEIAEQNGYARLEFGGVVDYYPGITQRVTQNLCSSYLYELDAEEEINRFDLALEMAQYLSDNYDYTLDPAPVPDGVDFVDWFISTGEGYCTYFASAMAQMARYAGIPSRYTEGYALVNAERGEGGEYLLTGEQAHAWAELYFDGVGFVPFDALSLERLNAEEERPDTPTEPPEVEMPTPTPDVEPSDIDEGDEIDEPISLWWLWLIIGVAAVVGAVIGAAAIYLKLRSLDRLRRKHGDIGAARELWREILALLPMIDRAAVRREGETSLDYAGRVRTLVIVPGAPFEKVADAGMRAWYAEGSITERDLVLLDNCASELRKIGIRRGKIAPR